MARMTLTKEIKAPAAKVWAALTTPDTIKRFWAPPGMETVEATIDKLEPGGVFIYSMKSAEGFQQWVKCVYEKVEEPTLLSFVETLVDEEGNEVAPAHYGMPGDEVKSHLTILELAEQDGVTTVSMHIDYGDDKTNEFASFGWKGMLENLANIFG